MEAARHLSNRRLTSHALAAAAVLVFVTLPGCGPALDGDTCVAKTADDLRAIAKEVDLGCDILVQNTSLVTLDGLAGLRSARGIYIEDNELLESIDVLADVSAGTLIITGNPEITSAHLPAGRIGELLFKGSSASTIRGETIASENFRLGDHVLVEMLDFPALRAADTFSIAGLSSLRSLSGFPSLSYVREIEIANNMSLPSSEISALLLQLEQPDEVSVTACGNLDDEACP